MIVVHSGYQCECLEIAAYHELIDEANSLGLQDCIQLFQHQPSMTGNLAIASQVQEGM
ncbi:MAG TPA: hypothetical protein VN954_14470 [Ktedonobacteraceae bacterium]|nr:hypothetical protein [Ktedonobacteraceae bacterium]